MSANQVGQPNRWRELRKRMRRMKTVEARSLTTGGEKERRRKGPTARGEDDRPSANGKEQVTSALDMARNN